MNLEDITRVIASYLDNQTLERVFLSGAMPSLLNLSLDQYFWHSRVETLSRRRLEYSSSIDWRDTYYILNEELQREDSSLGPFETEFSRVMWNEKDNVLVCEILLSLGYHPVEESLLLAAQNGSTKILQLLLQEGSINPGQVTLELYMLPITEASRYGHEEAVRLLLADSRVDPNTYDLNDTTPLGEACAAKNGDQTGNYRRIVKMLLEDGRADLGDGGYLNLASVYGDNVEIVRLLLSDSRIDPSDNDSAFIHASGLGREKIVALLLQDSRVNPSVRRNESLVRAASLGYIRVVDLLLSDSRVLAGEGLEEAISDCDSSVADFLLRDERIPLKIRENVRMRWGEEADEEVD